MSLFSLTPLITVIIPTLKVLSVKNKIWSIEVVEETWSSIRTGMTVFKKAKAGSSSQQC